MRALHPRFVRVGSGTRITNHPKARFSPHPRKITRKNDDTEPRTIASSLPSTLAQGASHEKNRSHLRHHRRPHHLRPDGPFASSLQEDRLRPQHDARLHHHGRVVPARLFRHPQLPRQYSWRSNILRPRLRLRPSDHPHHHRLLRRLVGDPLLQLHAPLHGRLLCRPDSPRPVLRTRPRHHRHKSRRHPALPAALPEPLRQHGLHLHRASPRRPHHHPDLRRHPPPQIPHPLHRHPRPHRHLTQRKPFPPRRVSARVPHPRCVRVGSLSR